MDIATIANTAGLIQEHYGSQNRQGQLKGAGDDSGRQEGESRQPARPEQVHRSSRINPEVLAGYHKLSKREASMVLQGVATEIAKSTPWRLAELQPVLDSKLMPSAYV